MKNKFRYFLLLCFPVFLIWGTSLCFAQNIKNAAFVAEINRLYKIDQEVQTNIVTAYQNGAGQEMIDGLMKTKDDTFKAHIPILKTLLRRYGFPSLALVGQEASNNFFTLVQHADSDIEFQKSFLKRSQKYVEQKQFEARNFAYLTDRVNLNSGMPQIYGTQVTYKEGQAVPRNLKDSENVNKMRAAVGLEPIEEYLVKLTELHRQQNTKKN